MPLSCNLGTLTSWNSLGRSRPVTGLLYYVYIHSICICLCHWGFYCGQALLYGELNYTHVVYVEGECKMLFVTEFDVQVTVHLDKVL